MPANLSPDYLAAEQDYRAARTASEKIAALERMLATIPKHKGTEKLQADLKRRISQTRKDAQKKGASHSTPFYLIEREGAGQVALIGPPNSGKSLLVRAVTHAEPEVADYPFTTRFPTPGMMAFETGGRSTNWICHPSRPITVNSGCRRLCAMRTRRCWSRT